MDSVLKLQAKIDGKKCEGLIQYGIGHMIFDNSEVKYFTERYPIRSG